MPLFAAGNGRDLGGDVSCDRAGWSGNMMTRRLVRWGMVITGTLFALDLSPCGPTGELMELVLPIVIVSLAT